MMIKVFGFLLITIAFLDTMTQLPILAPFVRSLGAGALSSGFIIGSYSFVNMLGNVAAGPLIDRYGRRRTITAGMAVAGVAVSAYALIASAEQLLAARVIHGAGGALLIPAVFTWAGDRAEPGAVGRSMGAAGAAVAFAALIGPAVGGLGGSIAGPRPVFAALGALLLVGSLGAVLGIERQQRASPGAAKPLPTQRLPTGSLPRCPLATTR